MAAWQKASGLDPRSWVGVVSGRMAKLRLLRIEGVRVDAERGEVLIEKLTFSFDEPKDSPSIDIDLLEAIELAVEDLKSGTIQAQVTTNSTSQEPTTEKCPYCMERDRNSDDHVFPAFLGGTATIRVCKRCNDSFGHDFEAAVSKTLGPLQVFLRACGLKAPRSIVWKSAFADEGTGLEFDLDSDLNARPS
ncbi:MAG: HNH endonuclease, partial [Candidatus Acidiferrales bacterium]